MCAESIRLIHCADLHLDSRMESQLTHFQAQERRQELLQTFYRMAQYASRSEIRAIMISGDFFDTTQVSAAVIHTVLHTMETFPDIDFLYLPGNHDWQLEALARQHELPANFHLLQTSSAATADASPFSSPDTAQSAPLQLHTMCQQRYGSVVITGLNQTPDHLPALSASCINIVMLHGMITAYGISHDTDGTLHYSLKELQGRNIDYIAAGHLHQFQYGKIDSRGSYCYSGCLEGRGFDECGDKGFVLLTIRYSDELSDASDLLKFQFIPFSSRSLYEKTVDLTDCTDHTQVEALIDPVLSSIDNRHLVKLILEGRIPLQMTLHTDWLNQKYQDDFYYFRLEDHTRPQIAYEDYRYDRSLRGEFIRLVLSSKLSETEKEAVILEGLRALSGEEVVVH